MATGTLRGSAGGYVPWTRPTDWLALPTVNVGDQKIVALVHVLPTGANTLISLSVAGAYTVDWGDGTAAQNVATGVQVTHSYDPTTLPATLTSDGFKQAILTVTPQAGNNLTAVDLSRLPTGASSGYSQPFRDIAMAGASVSALTLASSTSKNQARWFTYVGPSSITTTQNLIAASMFFLRGVTGTQWTATVTTSASMFSTCVSLETIPLFDTTAVADMNNMFVGCSRLRSVPLLNTGNVTNMASMFSGCYSLATIPLFDTSKVASFANMFLNCLSLTSIPLINTAAATTCSAMFSGCGSLASVPSLNTINNLIFTQMFSGCASVAVFPASFNTAKGTDFGNMFLNCYSMATHPSMDVSSGIGFGGMFQGCSSLTAISLNSSKGTNFTNLCWVLPSLRTVSVDCTLATVVTQMFSGVNSISSLILTGLRFAPPTLASNQLNAAALNALYTSLGTASGAQTLIVSSNPGSGSSTISIATAKGWTITGG